MLKNSKIIFLIRLFLIKAIFLKVILGNIIITELYLRGKKGAYYGYAQWVEIYNQSTANVDVADYKLWDGKNDDKAVIRTWEDGDGDYGSSLDDAVARMITGSTIIPPGRHALILDKDYNRDNVYNALDFAPDNTILLTVNTSSLEGGSYSISTGKESLDELLFYDNADKLIDTYGTPSISHDSIPFIEPPYGRSVERIDYHRDDEEGNWGLCVEPAGHTIGIRSSLELNYSKNKATSLAINPFSKFLLTNAVIGELVPIEIFALDQNNNISYIFADEVTFYFNEDFSMKETSALKNKQPYSVSRWVKFNAEYGRSGDSGFYLRSIYPGTYTLYVSHQELGTFETTITFKPFPGKYAGKVIITEILYDSAPVVSGTGKLFNERAVEWFEMYNSGTEPVSLAGFYVAKGDYPAVTLPAVVMEPAEYLIVAGDSTHFNDLYGALIPDNYSVKIIEKPLTVSYGLSKDDRITIYDNLGKIVDMAEYSSSWLKTVTRSGKSNTAPTALKNTKFISLKRRDYSYSALPKENWGNSHYPLGEVTYYTVDTKNPENTLTNFFSLNVHATPGFAGELPFRSEIMLTAAIDKRNYIYDKKTAREVSFVVRFSKAVLYTVRIYNKSGYLMGTLLDDASGSGAAAEIISFNGKVNEKVLKEGLYFFQIAARGVLGSEQSTDKVYFVVKD